MAEVTYEFSTASFPISRYTDPSEILDFCRDRGIDESEFYSFNRDKVEIDGDFIGFKVGGWDDLIDLASILESCDVNEEGAYIAYCHDMGTVCTYSEFSDAWQGAYHSAMDFAQEFCEECYDMDKLPEFLRYNIDWEGVASDFRHDYTFLENPSGGVYVFRNV